MFVLPGLDQEDSLAPFWQWRRGERLRAVSQRPTSMIEPARMSVVIRGQG